VAKRSEPRLYAYPPQTVFNAALAGLPATKLKIVGADPTQGTIWAERGAWALSWGEKVTIYIYGADQGQTAVAVDSALKFGLVSWGAHNRNHQTVFAAIDQRLGYGPPAQPQPQPYPQEQAPGPYPYQQQPAQPSQQPQQPQEPPPGATRF